MDSILFSLPRLQKRNWPGFEPSLRLLVKQSKGHIKIYSESGSGTTVKMYFPRQVGDAPEGKVRAAAEPLRTGTRDEIILVVKDDSVDVADLCASSLHELGYGVLESGNANDALAILDRETSVKLLFTDVVMPDINGKKLADEARRRRPRLKVLFTTGYTSNAVVHGGVLDRGVNFIGKPFTLTSLRQRSAPLWMSKETPHRDGVDRTKRNPG